MLHKDPLLMVRKWKKWASSTWGNRRHPILPTRVLPNQKRIHFRNINQDLWVIHRTVKRTKSPRYYIPQAADILRNFFPLLRGFCILTPRQETSCGIVKMMRQSRLKLGLSKWWVSVNERDTCNFVAMLRRHRQYVLTSSKLWAPCAVKFVNSRRRGHGLGQAIDP